MTDNYTDYKKPLAMESMRKDCMMADQIPSSGVLVLLDRIQFLEEALLAAHNEYNDNDRDWYIQFNNLDRWIEQNTVALRALKGQWSKEK